MAIAAEFERGGRELVVLDPHMLIPMPRPHCLADAELLPRIALSMTGGRRASLILANGNGEVWLEAGVGVGLPAGQSLSLGPGIVSRVLETRQPVVVQDLSETSFPAHPERGYETRSCMAVPVLFGTECHGVMCVSDPSRSQVFTADDFESLKLLTDHIGTTIRSMLSLQAQVNLDNLTGGAESQDLRGAPGGGSGEGEALRAFSVDAAC
ncbi:MAG TPA: GAF domain-containing protein [Chloroflexota bacterium]|nr:GAF domain-containing protein [Chloroflexota bacterium]